jgi:RNA polymerase sigma-70 factor (ECF subfamily)
MTAESRANETALVRSAQAGDRAAFGALYEQYRPLVHGILLSHVDYHAAEDLMQDTFVKAIQQLPTLRDASSFGGWLTSIARHIALDHHRRHRPETFFTDPASVRRPDREAFVVLEIIQRLPEHYRETLVLRLVEGMTGPEIASRTGLAPDSVRVNLCRGMKLLREQLESTKGADARPPVKTTNPRVFGRRA